MREDTVWIPEDRVSRELNDTAIPEEQDEFEHFVRWLNSYYSNIQKNRTRWFFDKWYWWMPIDLVGYWSRRAEQPNQWWYGVFYDSEEEETSDMHGYDFEFSFDIFTTTLKFY